jgi:hypothetical protein
MLMISVVYEAVRRLATRELPPRPVSDHALEPAELAAPEAPLEAAACAVLGLDTGDVLEDLLGAPGEGDEVVEISAVWRRPSGNRPGMLTIHRN